MIIKKLMRASLLGFFALSALMVQAQNTVVTNNWNVIPWNVTGPTLQTFTNMPQWAGTGYTNNGAINSRTDYRFWTNEVAYTPGPSLIFSTSGITNSFSGAKIQPGVPLFVDMRCKIYPFASAPFIATNTLLSFYSNSKSNLVVASKSASGVTQCYTNESITIATNVYYSVMIRFSTEAFDVFFDNSPTNVLSLNATTNEISKMVISGDGGLDDLYISYGDPRRSSTNSLITCGPGNGWSSTPSVEELVVKNWLANYATSGTYLKENAEKFYLINATNSVADQTFAGELGIGSINYNSSSTSVTVVVTLKTGADSATTKKQGKLNGVLKIKGATTYDNAKANNWSGVLDAVKIGSDSFTNGLATYTFTLTSSTNNFFLPVIQSNIQ